LEQKLEFICENLPLAQLVQNHAETCEYLPAAQPPVTAVRPVVAQYDPLGHEVHEVDPVEA